MLGSYTKDQLLDLVTRMESAMLDLDSEAQAAMDQGQKAAERTGGDATPYRSLATALKQRQVVLKPMIKMIKLTLANRARGN